MRKKTEKTRTKIGRKSSPKWVKIDDGLDIDEYLDVSKPYSVIKDSSPDNESACFIEGDLKVRGIQESRQWFNISKEEMERQINAHLFDRKIDCLLNEES